MSRVLPWLLCCAVACTARKRPVDWEALLSVPALAATDPTPTDAPPAEPGPSRAVRLVVRDLTSEGERPVALPQDKLLAVARQAAKEAGLEVDPDGAVLAGVELLYGLTVDGKPAPQADRGLLSWAAQVTLRVEDESGLAEEVVGRTRDESPWVKAATPDLEGALVHLYARTLGGAFRDAVAQIQFRAATEAEALAALDADHPELRWAGIRRLADLRVKTALPRLLEFLHADDDLTVEVTIAALGRLGDDETVEALAQAGDGPDPDRSIKVIEALGRIGTAKARKYLSLIGESHPVERVRERAKRVLDDAGKPR